VPPQRPTATLEHVGPGRVRARVVRSHRSGPALERVRQVLAAHPAVALAEVNPASGSVLVHGADPRQLAEALDQALELVRSLQGEEAPEAGVERVVGLVRGVDRRLREATGGQVSLRWLAPSIFIGLGVRQLLRQGLTIGPLPWYVLLYYGVDSFLKLYPEHAPAPRPAPALPTQPDGEV
jgi:hypothetical protein